MFTTYYCIFHDDLELLISSDIIENTKATIHEKCDAFWSPVGCIYGNNCDRIHISREYYYSLLAQKKCYSGSCCKKNHNKNNINHSGVNIKFNGRSVLIDPEYVVPTQCQFNTIMPHNICPFYLHLTCTYGTGCNNVHVCPKKLQEILPEVYNQALQNSKYLVVKYDDDIHKIYLNHILKTEYMIPAPKVKEEYLNQYTIPIIPISDICLEHLQGKCTENSLCQLLHVNTSYQKLRSSVISYSIKITRDKILCPYYNSENGCRYGIKCKYSHDFEGKKNKKIINQNSKSTQEIKEEIQENILLTVDEKIYIIPKNKIDKSEYRFRKAMIKNICTHHTHDKCETPLCSYLHINKNWLIENNLLDKIPKKIKDYKKKKSNITFDIFQETNITTLPETQTLTPSITTTQMSTSLSQEEQTQKNVTIIKKKQSNSDEIMDWLNN